MVANMIRKILLEISKSLRKEEFDEIKYLLKDEIGEGVLEKMKSPIDLFQKLEEQDCDGKKGINTIIEHLKTIRREDLAEKLTACSEAHVMNLKAAVPHYVEREDLSNKLLRMFQGDSTVKLCTIVGAVGVGKTELINDGCYQAKAQYHDALTIIQPMEATECSYFCDLIESIAHVLNKEPAPGQSTLSCVSQVLQRMKSKFILIIDVSKAPHTPTFCSELKKFTRQMLSNPSCKMVVSARFVCQRCTFKNQNFAKRLFVPYMDETHSMKVLRNLEVNWDEETVQSTIELCHGSPLLLEHWAESSTEITTPRKKSKAMCFHKFKVDEAFQEQFKGYSNDLKKSIIQLSAIKGGFSNLLASKILEDNEMENTNDDLSLMVSQQLLVKLDSGLFHPTDIYMMPPLIQEYVRQIIDDGPQEIKSASVRANQMLFKLFTDLLYTMNAKFMGFQNPLANPFYDEMVKEQEESCCCFNNNPGMEDCSCPEARKILLLYKRYSYCFEHALKQGMKEKSWMKAVDCANDCVSFLGKTMHAAAVLELFKVAMGCARERNDAVRHACTMVSVAFLSIYHHGCQSEDAQDNIRMLEKAEKNILSNDLKKFSLGLRIKEVLAHCYSKLGHLIAANHKDQFDKGLNILNKTLAIRQQEIEKGRGSNAMIAAYFTDLANIHKHSGNYEQAIRYGLEALHLYNVWLGQHPFTASTMHFIAEIYRLNQDRGKSSKFSLLAKSMSHAVSGHHLDTARFIRGHAETHADDGKQEAAKKLYKDAYEIGRPHYNKNEHIQVINRLQQLCTEDEIEDLEREAELIKRRCAVEWKPTLSCIDLPSQEREEETRGLCRRVSRYVFGKFKIRRATLVLASASLFLAVKCYGWYYNDFAISNCVCPDFVSAFVNKLSSYS